MTFPPVPVYPKAIDSDKTLYLVHNTTESKLRSDNKPWSSEIEIVAVPPDKAEIWADNGFANIKGELLYYDSVEKDTNGKVNKLKGCARQLTGSTKYQKKGTDIRGFVVAEHHNQLVDAILKIEDFVGINFDERQKTLDWRIRNLEELQVIFDDHNCPNIDFTFNTISTDAEGGVLTEYLIEITPPGTINSFRLDFGDGTFTTTELEGQHRYSINATIDPVVTVSNDLCEVIQTPIERAEPTEPPAVVTDVLEIPFPESPTIPDFTFVPCDVPEPDLNLPPLVFPCVSLTQNLEAIPISVEGSDLVLVSNVTITGPDNPVQILVSTVEFINPPEIPPVILIDPPVPPTIIIDPPIPPTIVIVPPQSNITLDLDMTELPRLEVDWGAPPDMEVALTMGQRVRTPERYSIDPDLQAEFGDEFADLFEQDHKVKVEYEPVSLPEEIRIIAPDIDPVRFDTSGIPDEIEIVMKDAQIPEDIHVHVDQPIPTSIDLNADGLPDKFELFYEGGPIPVDINVVAKLEMEKPIPEEIKLVAPDIPTELVLNADGVPKEIKLVAPDSIPVFIPEDVVLPVKFPDEIPEIEMVYKGSPIEVKITMDEIMATNENEGKCVMIVPCNR